MSDPFSTVLDLARKTAGGNDQAFTGEFHPDPEVVRAACEAIGHLGLRDYNDKLFELAAILRTHAFVPKATTVGCKAIASAIFLTKSSRMVSSS